MILRVIDSNMTADQAVYHKLPKSTPDECTRRLVTVPVLYRSFQKGSVHQGQVVVHELLASQVEYFFELLYDEAFPLESVIPVCFFGYNDQRSMEADNTSFFNPRFIAGREKVSLHLFGFAGDFGPRRHPSFSNNGRIEPSNGSYHPLRPGTLVPTTQMIVAAKGLDWELGAEWEDPKDIQHIQKVLVEEIPLRWRHMY